LLVSVTNEKLDNEIHRLCDLYSQGQFKKVLTQTTELLQRFPQSTALYIIEGDSNAKLKKLDAAINSYTKAINLKPNFAVSHFNLGVVLQDKGDLEAALESYKEAVTINPDYLEAHYNMATALHENGDAKEAINSYIKVLKINPQHSRSYNNMGNTLNDRGNYDAALVCFEKAIKLDPNFAEAYNNKGTSLREKGQLDKSVISFDKAISLKPDYLDAYCNKGISLNDQGKYWEALKSYNQALKYDPDLFAAKSGKLHTKRDHCDWSEFDQLEAELKDLGITTPAVNPFKFYSLEDHPERQLIRASKYVLKKHHEAAIPLPARPKSKSNKIRIGYFSADFQEHPVANQIAQVLALHNKEKFEVYAYSFNQADDAVRKKIVHAVDHFKDVSDISDRDVALLARKDKIDIAIDPMGYTKGSRTNIFAFRAAPVQILFLYESTMGAKFIDYIIADVTAVPESLQHHYQEKV